MVKQVQDIGILSEEWTLNKEQRFDLYICCAEALEAVGYHNDSFKVFHMALKMTETGNKNQKIDKNLKVYAEKLLTHAIRAPEIINFEEILLVDAVKDL